MEDAARVRGGGAHRTSWCPCLACGALVDGTGAPLAGDPSHIIHTKRDFNAPHLVGQIGGGSRVTLSGQAVGQRCAVAL